VSRSDYCDWTKPKSLIEASNKALLVEIKQIYAQKRATYGCPRKVRDLQDRWIRVGHKRIARTMREIGIVARTRVRYRVHTRDNNHDQPIAPNLLWDIPLPERKNLVWINDITYILT
jgi:transposase InsO family protein